MRKKENGLFEKRFTVEGKRYSAYGRSTKECAENELRIREEIKAGLYNSNKNITLDAYFDEWEKSRRGTIKDSSIKINRSKYNNHISKLFSLSYIRCNLIFIKHVYNIRLGIRNRNSISSVCVIKKCYLEAFFFINIYIFIVFLCFVDTKNRSVRMISLPE